MSDEHERPENDETGAPEGQEDLTRRSLPSRPGGPTTMRFRGLGEIPEAFDPDGGLSAEDEATIGALRHGTALLVVVRGPNNGARFLLDDADVTSGRHPESDINHVRPKTLAPAQAPTRLPSPGWPPRRVRCQSPRGRPAPGTRPGPTGWRA